MAPESILKTIQQQHPGQVFLGLGDAARILGCKTKTVRNSLSAGTFPIPTVKVGRLRKVAIIDLATHLDAQRGVEQSSWKRRGPTRKIATEVSA
jgi:hypothetical protein